MPKKLKPDAVILVNPFQAQVAIFRDLEKLSKYHRKVLRITVDFDRSAHAMASEQVDEDGCRWWSLYLPEETTLGTVVHECSHMVDFLMEAHGVPLSVANTEIRAYLLGVLFMDVCHELKIGDA
ncbi:hypothetical protein [Tritonibacter mobilis]|uniref:hypothetical protein n=1 Tax=Tritonibacter mobilis TaxID=379347 RepID=UPI000806A309|nr:hypothetical protein [Tritonibacter mobilis]